MNLAYLQAHAVGELLANGQRAVVPDVPTIASGSENMTVPTWDAKRNNGAISIEWKGPNSKPQQE